MNQIPNQMKRREGNENTWHLDKSHVEKKRVTYLFLLYEVLMIGLRVVFFWHFQYFEDNPWCFIYWLTLNSHIKAFLNPYKSNIKVRMSSEKGSVKFIFLLR